MKNNIIPASLAITSMRDSGYKTAAHAIAELIDNSIQATATNVQLLCIDKSKQGGLRAVKHVDQVAIFDDGKGMAKHVLQQALQFGGGLHREDSSGIGKFGMGLPSATISQCRRLDVYSWQNGICHYTYLDVNEIEAGNLENVPEPIEKPVPEVWREAIGEDYNPEHGTIAIWSDLDRISWKTSKSLYIHSEKLIGRMYRYFINDNRVKIRFKSFTNEISLTRTDNKLFKANDPLFLMKNTVLPDLPGNYINETFFEPFGEEQVIHVESSSGLRGVVKIKYSRVQRSIHQELQRVASVAVGSTKWGKIAAENQGVSIVRSGRELKVTEIFSSVSEPRERWFGVEVSFSPELDELFGVTFDKQDVVNFERIDLKVEAENEGYDSENSKEYSEFVDIFEREKSDRYWIYFIGKEIQANLKDLKSYVKTLAESKPQNNNPDEQPTLSKAEHTAKKIAEKRIAEKRPTNSDRKFHDPETPAKEKIDKIKETLSREGVDVVEAETVARTLVTSDCNVKFMEQPLKGNILFDVAREAGTIIVLLNSNHEFYQFYDSVDDDKKELLKLVLIAWAQVEDNSSETERSDMEDIRSRWGKEVKKYLFELNN
ncbi:ATP-binding protein [Parashewanella tropica]|uniref:ATP-binding protein n=1 Tax=Parashewanella tropica TaxID=2547970 RepID=UPI001059F3AD|nr:ATP-binding protein [Parashewanella tropica]